jgi:hypothetical protein
MTLKSRLKELKKIEQLVIVAPKFEHILTKTRLITISKTGMIDITYEDGQKQSRQVGTAMMDIDINHPSLFDLIAFVQAA